MAKVVYVPLDERPCNYLYPQMLADLTDLIFITPPMDLLGRKKEPADFEKLKEWIIQETNDADYLIVSIDMLLYGGIVPSRIHHLSQDECSVRLSLLKEIKQNNNNIKVYAFHLITRTPSYNNNDEEPEYYNEYGEQIFRLGWLMDRKEKRIALSDEIAELKNLSNKIPVAIKNDFLQRREKNHLMNLAAINLVKEGVIERLVIPLDDNSTFGFTSKEQNILTAKIEQLNIVDQVLIYPGADEVGCTLFVKVFTQIKNYRPEVYVRYSSTNGPFIIPKLEDRTLNESLKSQLTAVNAFMTDMSQDADFVLMVNSPAIAGDFMADGFHDGKHHTYYTEVNHREFVYAMEHYSIKGKMLALADVAIINGGDHQLLKLMSKKGLLDKIETYAGWNTVGNTLGTVISHSIIHAYYRDKSEEQAKSRMFYLYRLLEDWGYQSIIRGNITDHHLDALEADYFHIKHVKKEVSELIRDKLNEFKASYLNMDGIEKISIDDIDLPWNRMFEIGFTLDQLKI